MKLKHPIWLKTILNNSETGSSLMENLVVVMILAVLVVATTPPILLALATRIQARRTDSAITLAQQEIERIRLIVDTGVYDNDLLPPEDTSTTDIRDVASVDPPDNFRDKPRCPDLDSDPSADDCIAIDDIDYTDAVPADDSKEFYVQTFRIGSQSQAVRIPDVGTVDQDVVFRMGVRVYSKASREDVGQLRTEASPLYLTRGAGERTTIVRDGNTISARQRQFPLAVIYADFARGDLNRALERYHDFTR
jgi:type II secretory pathway pseudopilin PulG